METITPTSIDSTITWIAMGKDLIKCLKSKGNHRLSRYDAFLWIIENIQKGQLAYEKSGHERKAGIQGTFFGATCTGMELVETNCQRLPSRTRKSVSHHTAQRRKHPHLFSW